VNKATDFNPLTETRRSAVNKTITRTHVCGVTCHRGGPNCNNYCHDSKVPHPMRYEVALFDFGDAIRALKDGKRVARAGWNGKGMWLCLSPGRESFSAVDFWAPANRDYALKQGGAAKVLPSITMKTATGEILMGWLASQTDMLADDWHVVE
jgi:hypothetical protein